MKSIPTTAEKSSAYSLLVAILIVSSSVVVFEPAPYDLLLVSLLIYRILSGQKLPPYLGTPAILLAIFAISNILSAITANNPQDTIFYMVITFYLLLSWLFFTSLVFDDPWGSYRLILNAYIISALISVVIGMIGFFQLVPEYHFLLYEGRARGLFKDANVFGPFLVPPILYVASKLERGINASWLLNFVLLVFLSVGLMLSFSRGAWANLFISAIIYFILRILTTRFETAILRLFLLAIGAIGAILIFLYSTSSSSSIGMMLSERALLFQSYDLETGGRFYGLLDALALSLEHPLGVGPGQSALYLETEPHNLYVHILLENGWLGACAFLLFLGITIFKATSHCFKISPIQINYIIVYAATIGILLESLIIHSTHWRHLYLLLGLLWGPMLLNKSRISRIF